MKLQLSTGPRTKEVTLEQREVTLMLGISIGSNIGASIEHACQILASGKGGNVLYINTVQTHWKIADSIRKHVPLPEQYIGDYYLPNERTSDRVFFMTTDTGELYKEKEKILNYMRDRNVKTVIINSWEFAGKSSRHREALLFLFRGINNGDPNPKYNPDAKEYEPYFDYAYQPATVIVYAEALPNAPLAGKIHRGGFGKLAAIADQVISLEEPIVDSRWAIVDEEKSQRYVLSEVEGSKIESQNGKDQANSPSERTEVRSTVTTIEQLRKPERLDRLPIHLNNYSPDKAPETGIKIKFKSLK
jgi:hypothetical protein